MNKLTEIDFKNFFDQKKYIDWQKEKEDLQITLDFWTAASITDDVTFNKDKWCRTKELNKFHSRCYFCEYPLKTGEVNEAGETHICDACPVKNCNPGSIYLAWRLSDDIEVKQLCAKQILTVCQQTMEYIDKRIENEQSNGE